MSPNQAIPAEKSIRCSLLAAVGPLTILSWPEALNASRSKRACRMAIRCNACSLLALPDFPEFAQAVRYGVPATPGDFQSFMIKPAFFGRVYEVRLLILIVLLILFLVVIFLLILLFFGDLSWQFCRRSCLPFNRGLTGH